MKKFLSLLLALVMTMSLVTISAGATEYKDLTDKDELGPQYQEAVAVLNKIGVITGYDDGSFRPDVELTRGAAAKIIVSLLIGPEAASNLANSTAPYPDVPVSHTFAGVISYCKNAGIINGYGDGTFKPADPLSGYAFAKMLLSALGYDNNIEGFVGAGWTNNVLKIGAEASLFDRLDFKGSETVSRKDAALLALNTLKATVVEYKNGQTITVTGDNVNVVASTAPTYEYKTSNQEYARNILTHIRQSTNDGWNTVEFAEEHFVDLRLTHDKYSPIDDEYGRPSAEWSYKKLSIGTFPLEADFEYTTQVIHDVDTVTPASKVRALGLTGFNVDDAVVCVNGVYEDIDEVADIADYTDNGTLVQVYVDNNGADSITNVVVVKSQLMEVKRIGADYVSLELVDADGSDKNNQTASGVIYGFNQAPIDVKVNNIETGDDYFEFLSGLKAGDKVAVEPVAVNHDSKSYDVGYVYAPETVKGTLNGTPDRYGNTTNNYSALSVDVGGTTYKVSLWNKDLFSIDPDTVKITKKDVTLTLDRYGNAMLISDVGKIEDFMIVANYRQSIVNGILVTYANGWDIDGNELSLNIGARAGISTGNNDVWDRTGLPAIGSLVHYSNDVASNTAEWKLSELNTDGVYNIYNGEIPTSTTDPKEMYSIRANSSTVTLANSVDDYAGKGSTDELKEDGSVSTETVLMANNIKFIYVTADEGGELDTIEIKKTTTKVENPELLVDLANGNGWGRAQAAVSFKEGTTAIDQDSSVKAVVIKNDSNDTSYRSLMYVIDYEGNSYRDADGQMVQGYKVAMMSDDGLVDEEGVTVYSYNTSLQPGHFARYTKSTHADHPDDFYTLRGYGTSSAGDTGKRGAAVVRGDLVSFKSGNKNLMTITNLRNTRATSVVSASLYDFTSTKAADRNIYFEVSGTDNNSTFADSMLNLRNADWVDLSNYKFHIDSVDDLKDAMTNDDGTKNDIVVTVLFNDDENSDYFRNVYLIIVNSVTLATAGGDDTTTPSTGTNTVTYSGSDADTIFAANTTRTGSVALNSFGFMDLEYNFTAPSWVVGGSSFTATYDVKVDVGTGKGFELFAGGLSVTGTVDNAKAATLTDRNSYPNMPADGTIKVEITDIVYNNVTVTYYDGSVDDAKIIPSSNLTSPVESLSTTGVSNIAVQVSASAYSGITAGPVVVNNATITGGTWEATFDPQSGSDDVGGAGTTKIAATGKGPVQIVIAGLVKNTKFSISNADLASDMKAAVGDSAGTGTAKAISALNASFTSETSTLKVDFKVAGTAKMANIDAGDTVTVEATMSAAPAETGVAAYKVSIALAGVGTAWTDTIDLLVFNNTAKSDTFVMPSDQVKIESVTITKAASKLNKATTTAAYADHQLVITFNEEIAKDAAATDLLALISSKNSGSGTGTGAAKVNTVEIDGNKLVISLDAALADTETIIVPANKIVNGVTAVDDLNATVTVTYTAATDTYAVT